VGWVPACVVITRDLDLASGTAMDCSPRFHPLATAHAIADVRCEVSFPRPKVASPEQPVAVPDPCDEPAVDATVVPGDGRSCPPRACLLASDRQSGRPCSGNRRPSLCSPRPPDPALQSPPTSTTRPRRRPASPTPSSPACAPAAASTPRSSPPAPAPSRPPPPPPPPPGQRHASRQLAPLATRPLTTPPAPPTSWSTAASAST
jgi:hypothetical protein